MNKPVLSFFSTAGEAGFFSPGSVVVELSQPVVPFVFSESFVDESVGAAGFCEFADGVALVVAVVEG